MNWNDDSMLLLFAGKQLTNGVQRRRDTDTFQGEECEEGDEGERERVGVCVCVCVCFWGECVMLW